MSVAFVRAAGGECSIIETRINATMTRMSSPQRSIYSASNAVAAIAQALTEIKAADGLTDADIGAVLGKGEDMAGKYRTGLATMDVITYGRGKKGWGGRFTGYFTRLCEESSSNDIDDRSCETTVLKAALSLSVALADGSISQCEIVENRANIENAIDALRSLLTRVRVEAA